MIQRMGRVMRVKEDGRPARFAILFVKDTHEDPATGAHEAFFDQVLEIADEWKVFSAADSASELTRFLSP